MYAVIAIRALAPRYVPIGPSDAPVHRFVPGLALDPATRGALQVTPSADDTSTIPFDVHSRLKRQSAQAR